MFVSDLMETLASYTFEWYVDAGSGPALVQTANGAFDTLDGVYHFDKGDVVSVTTIVSDGSSNVSQSSTNITVLNTPPSAFNALIYLQILLLE